MAAYNSSDPSIVRLAGTLISVALVLQGAVELLSICPVFVIQHRCIKSRMYTRNICKMTLMLYGTSTLIIIRCLYRAIDSLATKTGHKFSSSCRVLETHELPLYVSEGASMLLYTFWINIIHPGALLPRQQNQYLVLDGRTERTGPGWVVTRAR